MQVRETRCALDFVTGYKIKLNLLYTANYRSHAVPVGFVETAASPRSGYSETQVRGLLSIIRNTTRVKDQDQDQGHPTPIVDIRFSYSDFD